MHRIGFPAIVLVALTGFAHAQDVTTYKVLATTRTSTMQKEMSAAASDGYRFVDVMGGETAFGGNEVVTLMQRTATGTPQYEYRLLAASRTSTMQRELQDAADAGFDFVGQTVFESLFGGREVTMILERDTTAPSVARYEYRLVATSRTSTLQKELDQLGQAGYQALAMTVGKTAVGGAELVVIARRMLR
jgi:hypothetical protein